MRNPLIILSILTVQVLSALFFVLDILSSFFGFSTVPLPWQLREVLEIAAAFGLLIGVALGVYMLRRAILARNQAELVLRRASGAFMAVLAERFTAWGLTPAEKDVALFAIKGLSTAEIASLRATSEGTIKAQTNAIYRKAEVSGRAQLISSFIEDLIEKEMPPQPAAPQKANQTSTA
jgi:DNA-binding CsgD family transcriptional regulator